MILPGLTSPLLPVIHAFYVASYALTYAAAPEAYLKVLRQQLETGGQQVRASAIPHLDLIVNERIGVTVLPATGMLTGLTRTHFRGILSAETAPEVALLMAFVPEPRMIRVDAPLARQRQMVATPQTSREATDVASHRS